MHVLEVKGITKKYPSFKLDSVSFALERGKITGFIGRNGAGKSTTLKSLFQFVHPEEGDIFFWGMNVKEHEREIKQRVGFVNSGIDYYESKKLKRITAVTKTFYDNWSEEDYQTYMKRFKLEEEKTPKQLSAGMKVKYSLALALSHKAELLVLDEPTSGLDPVSREELLDIFLTLCEEGKTILFSTHITSDLEKCADRILYLKAGRLMADRELSDFVADYKVVTCLEGELSKEKSDLLLGVKRIKNGYSALIKADAQTQTRLTARAATLEDIMVHMEMEVA